MAVVRQGISATSGMLNACLAALSASSLPGIPMCPGIHNNWISLFIFAPLSMYLRESLFLSAIDFSTLKLSERMAAGLLDFAAWWTANFIAANSALKIPAYGESRA